MTRLAGNTYRPSGFNLVFLRDPKPRLIARVPIVDRVVHTALVKLMEPIFLRSLLPDAYACRPGYGTHRAVLRLLELLRRYRFVLHLDVRSYFPSIDVPILRRLLARRIRDQRFLEIVDRILAAGKDLYRCPEVRRRIGLSATWPPAGRGLPIGAYTSQLFAAHVYLADLDHFVKRDLKAAGYLRYVDDFFVFADRRPLLERWRSEIRRWLQRERDLRLKHPAARVLSSYGHLDALGHRITRRGIEVLPRALRRFGRRVSAAFFNDGGGRTFARSVASSAGTALF